MYLTFSARPVFNKKANPSYMETNKRQLKQDVLTLKLLI